MDVRVVALVVPARGLDDDAGFLARCRIVEIDGRLAVHLLVEDRKVRADLPDVERRPRYDGAGLRGEIDGPLFHARSTPRPVRASHAPTASTAARRTGSTRIPDRTSPANASISMRRAGCSAMPRERR